MLSCGLHWAPTVKVGAGLVIIWFCVYCLIPPCLAGIIPYNGVNVKGKVCGRSGNREPLMNTNPPKADEEKKKAGHKKAQEAREEGK